MKPTIANTLSNHNSSTTASRRNRIGLLAVIAFFVCSFAGSASAWTNIPSPAPIAGIQVGTSQVWARDFSDNVYQYQAGTLVGPMNPTPFKQIAVGKGQSVLGLDSLDNIYRFDFTTKTFVHVAGSLSYIAAGAQGVWGVNSKGKV